MKPSHGHDQAIVDGVSRIGYMTGGKSALWVDENIVDTLTKKATTFIDQHKAEPFFLYFATPKSMCREYRTAALSARRKWAAEEIPSRSLTGRSARCSRR